VAGDDDADARVRADQLVLDGGLYHRAHGCHSEPHAVLAEPTSRKRSNIVGDVLRSHLGEPQAAEIGERTDVGAVADNRLAAEGDAER
jgi:hypothetical protein